MAEDDTDEPGGGLGWGSLLSTPAEWHYLAGGLALGWVLHSALDHLATDK